MLYGCGRLANQMIVARRNRMCYKMIVIVRGADARDGAEMDVADFLMLIM